MCVCVCVYVYKIYVSSVKCLQHRSLFLYLCLYVKPLGLRELSMDLFSECSHEELGG